ncbi:hypothetical protein O6H91_13G059600 [Diphasiastrum complanatum]|uniref:Uncharacterized protein n=1 Tax=Diphasiastrum complanatum TaxID=34168 RepID=A0ACC2BV57_DIPCM|nr:hypothetical protein O6H91_13G059600 [Diphasiastrum complanatum]
MVAATAKAQLVKEATQISEQESLQLTRNLLRIAIFNISYIRGLFPEKYFEDKFVPALEMKIKKLLPLDVESRRLIDWMEKGVYDALQKRYLKTLLFGLCDIEDGPLVEEYDFSFFYPNDSSDDVTMVLNKNGNKSHVNSFSTTSYDLTPTQMKISACKMVRTLVQLMRTLNHIPDERTIIMKLHYYDDITPEDYEPPYFRSCTYEDKIPWSRVPLKMKVGEVNSKHFAIALKVRSILDPCEDENEAKNSKNGLMTSSSDSEASSSSEESEHDGHQKVTQNRTGQVSDAAAAVSEGKTSQQLADNQGEDSENTEDTATEAENLERLKQWLLSRATNRIEMCDVLSDFPDISMVHIEELMNCLIKDGFLKSLGRDIYEVKQVEEEVKEVESLNKEKYLEKAPLMTNNLNEVEEKTMYMKALYHALPLEYVSVAQLQSKLQGEVNQSTARKLMDKMAIDGFIEETASNRRMGTELSVFLYKFLPTFQSFF